MPKVSVVMPVFNAESYINEAIDSILSQTYSDFEFIIINDCSTDLSYNIIKSYEDKRIKIINNEKNLGVCTSLNKALRECKGEFIARMDSDDVAYCDRLEKQVNFLENNKQIVVLGTSVEFIGQKKGIKVFDNKNLEIQSLFNNFIVHPTVMMRSEFFKSNNLYYSEKFSTLEDYELWDRVLEKKGKFYILEEPLLKYRVHKNQITQSYSKKYFEQIYALKSRQLKRIGVNSKYFDFEVFFNYCNGSLCLDKNSIKQTLHCLECLIDANSKFKFYDVNSFTKYVTKLKNNLLSFCTYNQLKELNINFGLLWRILLKRKLKYYYRVIRRYINTYNNRKLLNNKNFTIISNNCWGGNIYQHFGLKYNTPTIGLYITGCDFVKFCSCLDEYLSSSLEFIKWEDAKLYDSLNNKEKYPVGKLKDIEIYFMHYKTEEEALEKWNDRKKRINKKHILFKLSQRESCSREDISRFMNLPLKNKLCFSYECFDDVIYVPELENFHGDESNLINGKIDIIKILNSM